MAIQMMPTLMDMWWREHKNVALPEDIDQLSFEKNDWIVKMR